MIIVAGETLIDLVIDHDGRIGAQPGGGPFNTARTIGRLGLAPVFLGRLSQDSFGSLLRASLDQDGVTLGVPQLVDAPTTLAAVDVDPAGAPRYRFHLAGTSIGAGDAFGGAFLALWSGMELTRSDLHRHGPVREALQASVEVASLTCTRVGAEPPWLAEVRGRPGWRSGPGTKRRQPLP